MHISVSKPCKSYIFLMWDQSGQSQAEKLALKGSLKEHRICSMSPTLRANCLINIIHVHLMISCLSLKNLPAYLDLMWLWENRSWSQCKKKLSVLSRIFFISTRVGLVLFQTCKVPKESTKPKIFKAKDFSVKTICLKRVLLLVTQDQPAFLDVHLLVMYHLMWWLTNH